MWIAVDEDVARTAGSLARKHRKAVSGIDDADYLIAATALFFDVELLTTNVPLSDAPPPSPGLLTLGVVAS